MKNVLLFASGSGSNVRAILNYFKDKPTVHFPVIIANNRKAGVLDIAKENKIDVILVNKTIFEDEIFIDTLDSFKPDLLVLAGFLWKIPSYIISKYDKKTIYRIGDVIHISDFDLSDELCSTGFHFFLTKKEAENYN